MEQLTNINENSMQMRIMDLEEENTLLFGQLQIVQEELERNHLERLEHPTQPTANITSLRWVDDDLPAVMAENTRYRAILETQRLVHRLETQHALASELGQILIEGTSSFGALLAVPSKLFKIWLKEKKQSSAKRNRRQGVRKGYCTLSRAWAGSGSGPTPNRFRIGHDPGKCAYRGCAQCNAPKTC